MITAILTIAARAVQAGISTTSDSLASFLFPVRATLTMTAMWTGVIWLFLQQTLAARTVHFKISAMETLMVTAMWMGAIWLFSQQTLEKLIALTDFIRVWGVWGKANV